MSELEKENKEDFIDSKRLVKKFVRYDEGAKLYSMSKHSFMKLAKDAGAIYKIGGITLVNTVIFEKYLETFRV